MSKFDMEKDYQDYKDAATEKVTRQDYLDDNDSFGDYSPSKKERKEFLSRED